MDYIKKKHISEVRVSLLLSYFVLLKAFITESCASSFFPLQ